VEEVIRQLFGERHEIHASAEAAAAEAAHVS
jgi:predicted component of type VI protein secretion system